MTPTSKKYQQKRNWLDLPSDVTANILSRLDMVDLLQNGQKVCTAWHNISKDPAMWRVVNMHDIYDSNEEEDLDEGDPNEEIPSQRMFRIAVDRSQGQLDDLTLVYTYYSEELIFYLAERPSQLRRLEMVYGYGDFYRGWIDALEKFPLLEELNLYSIEISKEEIEALGRYCPMLNTLKVNTRACRILSIYVNERDLMRYNEIAVAIGENLHELRHLELIGNDMTNVGLQAILDGCRHLETLDLRECVSIDLKGDLGKRCSEQVKCLKLPNDSLEDYPY